MKATRKYSLEPNSAIFCLVTECNRMSRLTSLPHQNFTSYERTAFVSSTKLNLEVAGFFGHDISHLLKHKQFWFLLLKQDYFQRTGQGYLLHASRYSLRCSYFSLLTFCLISAYLFQRIVNKSHERIVLSDTFYNGVFLQT